jgi:hypothetical protein
VSQAQQGQRRKGRISCSLSFPHWEIVGTMRSIPHCPVQKRYSDCVLQQWT